MTTYEAIRKIIETKTATTEMIWEMLMKAYGRYIDGEELEELWGIVEK